MTHHKNLKNQPILEVTNSTYSNPEELLSDPSIKNKINHLLKFFDETGIKYDKFDPDLLKDLSLTSVIEKKKAYPNVDYYMHVPGQRDTQKWLDTVKNIYYQEKNGNNRIVAIKQATQGWNIAEIYDFLNWLRYYEGNNHIKYKFAQLWYEGSAPGYFLHVKPDSKKDQTSSSINEKDIDLAHDALSEELPIAEKKRIIEKQRSKIVGRLDSAEKLLRTHEGQIFAGKEFESLLETIYQLKKKLQLVNKISTSTKLYQDMIIREANILNRKGFNKAAQMLFSLSQNKPVAIPTATPPDPPSQNSGAPGGLPSTGPGMPQNPPESAPNETTPTFTKGMSEFLDKLDTSNIGSKDDKNDVLEVEDTLDVYDDSLEDKMLITEAQEISPSSIKPSTTKENISEKKEPLNENMTSKDITTPVDARNFDHQIDSIFANVKISDVVLKLEDLAKIFKTREIPRQLSIADMMLDSLGLAAYFPSLSEATNKALESNNYIATRIDDILAKLHGSIETKEIDLKGDQSPRSNSPEINSIRQNLNKQEEQEKIRKKQRKDQANQELDQVPIDKETPNIEIEEDLNQPTVPTKEKNIQPPPSPPKPPPII